jgi:putative addiction module component (TIGR02574 family)
MAFARIDFSMATDPIFKQALSLSPDDRVRLIDELLKSVVSDRSAGELDDAQKAELLRRLVADRADAGAAIPWEPECGTIPAPAA